MDNFKEQVYSRRKDALEKIKDFYPESAKETALSGENFRKIMEKVQKGILHFSEVGCDYIHIRKPYHFEEGRHKFSIYIHGNQSDESILTFGKQEDMELILPKQTLDYLSLYKDSEFDIIFNKIGEELESSGLKIRKDPKSFIYLVIQL